jgi:aspartyl-tRNA(Asn)/glutamyl-tRNA(Gln) amidotransferase subunit B
VKKEGLEAVSDGGQLETIIKTIVDNNPKVIEEYKSGKAQSLNFLVGQVMRETRGAASAPEVIAMIKKIVD